MTIIEKNNRIAQAISYYFHDLPEDAINESIDRILAFYISRTIETETLDDTCLQIIEYIQDKIIKVKSKSLNDFIVDIASYIRESSRGAVRLKAVFVPIDLDFACITLYRDIKIIKTKMIPSNNVLGICEAKFQVIPSKLVIEGILAEK